jgi:peroxiredoxin
MSSSKIKVLTVVIFCLMLFAVLACTRPGISTPVAVSDNTSIGNPTGNNYTGKIQNGELAPDFTFMDVNGNEVTLSELRGNKVVLNLWWMKCHGCTDEMPFLQEFYENNSDQGVILIAINNYERDSAIKAYVEAKEYTFTVIADSNKQLHKGYTNWGVPTTFFIDEEGVIAARKDAGFISAEEIEEMYNSY